VETFNFIDNKGSLKQGHIALKCTETLTNKEESKNKKQLDIEGEQVMGIEDVEMRGNATVAGSNVMLFRDDEVSSFEDKLTAASNQGGIKASGSVATVLVQALTSEDQQTLDWVFQQKEQSLIS
jgi:hypothetical protein